MTAVRPPLPKRRNPLLQPDLTPQKEILVERRRLGQTTLAVKPGQVGTSNATKPENLGTFDYAHLRVPLPKDLKGSEVFAPQQGQPHPESYFLMRRSHDGFVSATGMFKASFPWAKHSEEEAERKYIKSLPTTGEDEVAGNVWISPSFALELAEEYQMKPWIEALLDPESIEKGPTDKGKAISPPPKFIFTANDNNSILPPPTPRGRGRPRSRSPSKGTTSSRKLTAPRKTKSTKAANAAMAREANASLHATLDSAASVADSESVDEDRVRIQVDSAVDVNGDIEVTTTSVKLDMPAGYPDLPLPESTEEMIAKAKEMVEEARKLEGTETTEARNGKRKIDVVDDDETPDTDADKDLLPVKKARLLQSELKKERVRSRALTGIAATLLIGQVLGPSHPRKLRANCSKVHYPICGVRGSITHDYSELVFVLHGNLDPLSLKRNTLKLYCLTFIPLSMAFSEDIEVAAPTVHELQKGSEWRFEVAFGNNVELLSGTAEIFGTELAPKQTYSFTGTKAAVYTWHGCRLEVSGDCQVEYTAEETPMVNYANTHFALEKLRQEAGISGKEGPRVLIVGPENAGKTSLVKILTGYATRIGRQPLVVNLDSREGMLSVPGSLSAAAFSSIVDVEEGWGSSPTSGPSPVPVKLPLVYYYGLPSPEGNSKMFKPIVTRLALAVMSRLQEDGEAREAGCLIDTPGVISQGKGGYDIIQHVVAEFSINVLIVLGSERLYSDMARRFNGHHTSTDEIISVVKLDKSGGCVDRDEAYMKQARQAQIREYFFGDAKITLSPHTQQVDFNQVTIYKVAESSDLLTSLLPGGESEDISAAPIFEKVHPSLLMQNCILAIMHADPNDSQENIRDASVMGFVYVAEVDEKRKKMRVLAPVSGRMPNRAVVWGSWPEGVGDLVG